MLTPSPKNSDAASGFAAPPSMPPSTELPAPPEAMPAPPAEVPKDDNKKMSSAEALKEAAEA